MASKFVLLFYRTAADRDGEWKGRARARGGEHGLVEESFPTGEVRSTALGNVAHVREGKSQLPYFAIEPALTTAMAR